MRGSLLRTFWLVVVGMALFVMSSPVALAADDHAGSDKTASATPDEVASEVADVKNDPLPIGDFELQTALGDAQKKIESLEADRKTYKDKVNELKPNYNKVKTFTERLDGSKTSLEGNLTTIEKLDCKADTGNTALNAAVKGLSEALAPLSENSRLPSTPFLIRSWLIVDPNLDETSENGKTTRETCEDYKKRISNSKSSLMKGFEDYRRESDNILRNYKEAQDDLTKTNSLIAAWREKKARISKSIQTLRDSARSEVNDQLPLLIAILGVFSLSIMVMVRRFSQDIQREWVVSGQVIQFMTVTIIISAVIALGLARILDKDILGTLLGAIGGYVLSQGVGRAVTNKIDNVEQQMAGFLKALGQARLPNGESGSNSQTNSGTNNQSGTGAGVGTNGGQTAPVAPAAANTPKQGDKPEGGP